MLDRIHAGRVAEFRRALRACAIAVSAGRHAVVLRIPHGQDPDGFARAFHRHCREKAGRPVRLLGPGTGTAPLRRLADLLGVEGPALAATAPLADLPGARDRWFERIRQALAADLATDGLSAGPGLMVIEGPLSDQPALGAFLSYLCPESSPWRALPASRPRAEQFALVAVVEEGPGGSDPAGIPAGAEVVPVRSLEADDLRAAADAATDLLLNGWNGRPKARPAARRPAPSADPEALCRALLDDGELERALAAVEAGAALAPLSGARVLAAAGRSDEALRSLSAVRGRLDPEALLEAGRLAVAQGRPTDAVPFLDSLAKARGPARGRASRLRALLAAELAFARGEPDAAPAAEAAAEGADADLRGALWNVAGSARFRAGDLAGARRDFEAVVADGDAADGQVARARHNLGLVALREDRHAAAIALLQEAVQEADALGEVHGAALARRNLAIALEHAGRYAPALELAVEAADRLCRQGRSGDLAAALLTVADLLLTFGEWDRALSLVADAEAAGGDRAVVAARCAFKRAEAALLRGQADAVPALRDAHRLLCDAGLHDMAVFAAARTAEAALACGDAAEAARWIARVLPPGCRDRGEAAGRGLRVRGLLELAAGEPARAVRTLERARRLLAAASQREPLALTLAALADAREALEDPDTAVLREEARSLATEVADSVPAPHRSAFRARPGLDRLLDALPGAALPALPVARPAPVAALAVRPRLRHLLPRIVGTSTALDRVLVSIERLRDVPVPVLLQGESGTGKELFAEALHRLSPRADRPFVRVNAAAFPDTLLLSELFGHEKGAFTGAHQRRIGRFESAHGGTLFLDEIGDVSESTQAALLRVIEEQRFTRVGGSETVSVDVRLVFATNRNLEDAVRSGRMRRDFYHRIAGLTIPVPPLRERAEDIPALADAFLADLAREQGHPVQAAPDALELLCAHAWPGNIRELRNVVRKAVLLSGSPVLTAESLRREAPELARAGRRVDGSVDLFDRVFVRGVSLFDARREMEVALIREALERSRGNISAAAALLGMKRPRLSQMVKDYDLKIPTPARAKEAP